MHEHRLVSICTAYKCKILVDTPLECFHRETITAVIHLYCIHKSSIEDLRVIIMPYRSCRRLCSPMRVIPYIERTLFSCLCKCSHSTLEMRCMCIIHLRNRLHIIYEKHIEMSWRHPSGNLTTVNHRNSKLLASLCCYLIRFITITVEKSLIDHFLMTCFHMICNT